MHVNNSVRLPSAWLYHHSYTGLWALYNRYLKRHIRQHTYECLSVTAEDAYAFSSGPIQEVEVEIEELYASTTLHNFVFKITTRSIQWFWREEQTQMRSNSSLRQNHIRRHYPNSFLLAVHQFGLFRWGEDTTYKPFFTEKQTCLKPRAIFDKFK